MPFFSVLFGKGIAFSFLCTAMNYRGFSAVFCGRKSFGKGIDVMAVSDKDIFQAERLEEVIFDFSVLRFQTIQEIMQSPVIFGNGHIVVIDHNNHRTVQLRYIVQRFKGFSAV